MSHPLIVGSIGSYWTEGPCWRTGSIGKLAQFCTHFHRPDLKYITWHCLTNGYVVPLRACQDLLGQRVQKESLVHRFPFSFSLSSCNLHTSCVSSCVPSSDFTSIPLFIFIEIVLKAFISMQKKVFRGVTKTKILIMNNCSANRGQD